MDIEEDSVLLDKLELHEDGDLLDILLELELDEELELEFTEEELSLEELDELSLETLEELLIVGSSASYSLP